MGRLDVPGQLWLYRTKPLDDELFSSWLVRLSWGLALKLQTFSTQILKLSPGFWTHDVDRRPDISVLARLCDGTAVTPERAWATGLGEFEGRLWETATRREASQWVMPIGKYGRRRYLHGQQFCSQCLLDDRQPYFRRKWRLAFNVACEVHGVYLLDACPRCGSPVEFHAGDFGERLLPMECQITRCKNCKWDLRAALPGKVLPVSSDLLDFQRKLNECLDKGWSHALPGAICYSHLFFTGLRQLVHLACSSSRFARARQMLLGRNGALCLEIPHESPPVFETLRIGERAAVLDLARQLLLEWPFNFVELCKQSRVSSSYLLNYRRQYPYWLRSEIEWYLNDRDYAPTHAERRSAKEYLLKHNLPVSKNSINRLLGVSYVSRQTLRADKRNRWNPRGPIVKSVRGLGKWGVKAYSTQ